MLSTRLATLGIPSVTSGTLGPGESNHILRLFGMPVGIRETAQRCKRFGVTRVTSLSQGPELPSEGNPFIHKFYRATFLSGERSFRLKRRRHGVTCATSFRRFQLETLKIDELQRIAVEVSHEERPTILGHGGIAWTSTYGNRSDEGTGA